MPALFPRALSALPHVGLLALALLLPGWAAAEDGHCDVREATICDARRFSSCGPITIRFWESESGTRHCERAIIELTKTDVMPNLRRLRCYFYGEKADIRFDAENYETVLGPEAGEVVEVRDGVGEVLLSGRFRVMSQPPQVSFENVGPARAVVIKCNGFGPA